MDSIAFQTDVDIRMRGFSSASFPQKSLNVYFKNKYALDTIEHAFFQDSNNNAIAPQHLASNGIFTNKNEVATNYTFVANHNGMSAGPVTVASGVTVTVPSGSNWVIV